MFALITKEIVGAVLEIATNIQGKNPVGVTAANTNPVTIGGVNGDNEIVGVVLNDDGSLLLPDDAATETTLASILTKIITAPATEAKQDTLIAKDFATQATLAEIKKFDGGIATDGSKTTIIDTGKDWEANMFAGHTVKVFIGAKEYLRTVSSNTADTLTMATLPGAAASVIIGTPGTAEVTVTYVNEGVGGNSLTAEVVEAPGDNDNLSASLTGTVLTVYLGKTGGVLDGAKNTATLVAAFIDTLPEFTAAMTGSGGVVPVAAAVPFAGGIAVVDVTAGSEYQIMRKTVVSDGGGSVTVDGNVSAQIMGSISGESADVDNNNRLYVNIAPLLSSVDSIDVSKMTKAGITVAHSAIEATATSSEIDCDGFNSVLLHVVITGTGTWKIDVQCSPVSAGTFINAYDGTTQLTTGNLTASACMLFRGIMDYVKIVATEVADGATCTVTVQPLNL